MAPRFREIDSLDTALEVDTPLIRPLPRTETAFEPAAPATLHAAAAENTMPGGGVLGGPVAIPGDYYHPVPPRIVFGGPGNDYIYGGAGNDILFGNGGDDFISAGSGNDYLSGGSGNDRLKGGLGHDRIFGGSGNDELRGNSGNDVLSGGAGNDLLLAGDDNDQLDGGAGVDVLEGGAGNDHLLGGDGADTLNGGEGSDRLDGGKGRDVMTGGYGSDVFAADLNGNAWNSHHYQPDVVTDFAGGSYYSHDKVDLGAILDKTLLAGITAQQAHDQGFVYLVGYYDAATSLYGTRVMVDYNGNAPDLDHTMGDIAVLELQGVSPSQLSFSAYSGHFLV